MALNRRLLAPCLPCSAFGAPFLTRLHFVPLRLQILNVTLAGALSVNVTFALVLWCSVLGLIFSFESLGAAPGLGGGGGCA